MIYLKLGTVSSKARLQFPLLRILLFALLSNLLPAALCIILIRMMKGPARPREGPTRREGQAFSLATKQICRDHVGKSAPAQRPRPRYNVHFTAPLRIWERTRATRLPFWRPVLDRSSRLRDGATPTLVPSTPSSGRSLVER